MLIRFSAAAVVASIAVAIAAGFVLMLPNVTLKQVSPLLVIWCMAPCIWGIWAMLARAAWVPKRLALWGTLLGLIAGLLAMFGLNMPHRVFGVAFPSALRAAGALLMVVFYYLLWRAVGFTYQKFLRIAAAKGGGTTWGAGDRRKTAAPGRAKWCARV